MATFGDLVVRLGLDKSGFDRGIAGAKSTLTTLKSVAVPVAGAVAALAAATGAAALAFKEFVAPSFEALDVLGDLSNRLGVSTDKLAALQHAAKMSGIEQDSLTQATGKFLNTLSDAANGTKSAAAGFTALGLKASDLKNLALDDQFVAVARAFENIKNPADRIRIAMDLFGKSGAQMLQLLNGGATELIATLEDAHALGIAPSNEEVARIQRANDALDRMSAAWTGIANTVAIEVAPAVEDVANTITSKMPAAVSTIKSLAGMFDLSAKNMALTVAQAWSVTTPLATLAKTWNKIADAIERIKGASDAAGTGAMADLIAATAGGGPVAAAIKSRIGKLGLGGAGGGLGSGRLGIAAGGGLGGQPGGVAPGRPIAQGIGGGLGGLGGHLIIGGIGKGAIGIGGGGAGLGGSVSGLGNKVTSGVAPGGVKNAQDTLQRILSAGSHTKDPNTPILKNTEKFAAKTAKAVEKMAAAGAGGFALGAAGAGT